MTNKEPFSQHRLLLFYKSDISALMLFAQHNSGSVCFPESLPALSSLLAQETGSAGKNALHPSVLLTEINRLLDLDNDLLRIENGFSQTVDAPDGPVTVHMARFMMLDPPHQLMQSRGCRMRTLPELRGRPPAEMELLRRAYAQEMES